MRLPFAVPDAAGKRFDIVGLGQNSVDYVAVAAAYPASNTKRRLDRFACLPGGQVATAMVACARLGWRTRYIGAFGSDEPGRVSRESLIQEGVDVSAARVIDGATNRVAVILVNAASGERTILWHRDPALNVVVPVDAVTSGRLLLVDGDDMAAATEAATAARRAGIPTMVDIDDVQPGIEGLLRQVSAIIAAEDFPSALTGHSEPGKAIAAIAREYSAPLVCVTLGAAGSLAICGGREIRTAACAVECVDTTGAGDAFRGGFAAGCLRWPDGDIERILAYANATAALSCRAVGARAALPAADEIDRLLYPTA
jgi:sulfofructose kinase